jgi:hypothetical protein
MRGQPRGAAPALTVSGRVQDAPPNPGGQTGSPLELLLDCVTAHRVAESRARLHRRLAGPVDWGAVLDSACRHGVAPLVYQELRAAPDGLVPPSALTAFQQFNVENTRRCLLLTGWLRRVVDRLARAGVQAVPYKGPVLAALAYGALGARQAGDLDLLIDSGALAAARQALEADGFRPQVPLEDWQERQLVRSAHPYGLVRDSAGVVLELHWSVSPRALSSGLGTILPRDRLEEVAVAGTRFLTLPVDVLVVALCVHGAKHVWERLGWIVDVAELIAGRPALDWTGVLACAEELGHRRELLLGCLLARDLLRTSLPEPLARGIAADPKLPALARAVSTQLGLVTHGRLGIARTARFHLEIRGSWKDRLAYVRYALMPTVADWTSVPLPRWLAPLHYPLRAARLLRGGAAHHH